MSDWGATHSTVNAAMYGLDQEQPDMWCIASLRARFVVGIFDYPATIQPSTLLAMPRLP
jgi:hypothetical protein